MERDQFQQTAYILSNILRNLLPVIDNYPVTGRLKPGEQLRLYSLNTFVKDTEGKAQSQPASRTVDSLKKELDVLIPIFQKCYGEKAVIESVSLMATDASSIELLRSFGIRAAADLCEKARSRRIEDRALNSGIFAADRPEEGPRCSRLAASRGIADDIMLQMMRNKLKDPKGPLAGKHRL